MTAADRIAAVAEAAVAILPPNATNIEKSLLAAELASLQDVDPRVLETIWDPYRCPEILLPYLAFGVSVDVWDDSWSEQRKRDVIAASPAVHRIKGVRAAVERALAALDLEFSIDEWWETEPVGRRGTFSVDVFHTEPTNFMDEDLRELARLSVKSSKPKSRTMQIAHHLTGRGTAYVGAHQHIKSSIHVIATQPDPDAATAPIGVAAIPKVTSIIRTLP